MAWSKIDIIKGDGTIVQAQAPVIISASRSTDIPAFYADWFFHRLEKGYSAWTNPFNGVRSYVVYQKTRFIVFWSKNPRPLIPYIDYLKAHHIGCYIQYTLNDYESEQLEKNVPDLQYRIDTFKMLVDKLGKGSVVWRFDPLVLTDEISQNRLLEKIQNIGDELNGYTEKLVFSYADISSYRKVKNNLDNSGIRYMEWDEMQMRDFAQKLWSINHRWNYDLATCGEKIDLSSYGIQHNHCVDETLIARLAYRDRELMKFLGIEVKKQELDLFGESPIPDNAIRLEDGLYAVKTKDNRDKGQRLFCGCMVSKDIGEYNTCPHLCEYCYANSNKETALKNYGVHMRNPDAETITGR